MLLCDTATIGLRADIVYGGGIQSINTDHSPPPPPGPQGLVPTPPPPPGWRTQGNIRH